MELEWCLYHFSSGSDVAIEDLYNAVVKAMDLPQYPHPEIKELGEDDVVSILLDPSRTLDFERLSLPQSKKRLLKQLNILKNMERLENILPKTQ